MNVHELPQESGPKISNQTVTAGRFGREIEMAKGEKRVIRSDQGVRAARNDTGKPVTFNVEGVPGLRLRVGPSRDGVPGVKSWIVQFTAEGRPSSTGLGCYPAVTLAMAKAEARRIYVLAKAGTSVVQARRDAAVDRALTFETVARDVHAAATARFKNERDVATWLASLATYVFPRIGDRPIARLTRAEVVGTILAVEKTGKKEVARKLWHRCRQVTQIACDRGLIASDPLEAARSPVRKAAVEHRVALPASALPAFLAALPARRFEPATRAYLEVLALTAVRPGELAPARWGEIDLDAAVWRVPARRMKVARETDHVVPLSPRAVACLRDLAAALNVDPVADLGVYVFARVSTRKPPSATALLKAARSVLPGYGEITLHGFRACFRTWAQEAEADPDVAEAVLGHFGSAVSRAYARSAMVARRRALLDLWARHASGEAAADPSPFAPVMAVDPAPSPPSASSPPASPPGGVIDLAAYRGARRA